MKVAVSAHGRWHAFELAAGLHQQGNLSRLLTTYPRFIAAKFVPEGVEIRSVPLLELRRRAFDKFSIGGKPDLAIAKAFGRFAAAHLPGDLELFVGWSSATLEVIPVLTERGVPLVLERGSTHIGHQTDILTEGYARTGSTFSPTEPEIIERELMEYEAATAIAVPTLFAAGTFTKRGIAPEKLIVNPYGVDLKSYTPREAAPGSDPVRIILVGSVSIRKGAPWLIEAAKSLQGKAQFEFIGPVEPAMADQLNKGLPENVTLRGALPAAQLPDEYRRADIFCLPSLEEGFPLSLLQAMACGLPCVTTREASGDLNTDGETGYNVAPMDAKSLAEALEKLVPSPSLRREMGRSARQKVENGFGWSDYAGRAVSAYEKLLEPGP